MARAHHRPGTITVERDGSSAILVVTGEVDLARSHQLVSAFLRAWRLGARRVQLDATGVTFMDCSGLRVMTAMARKLRTAGGFLMVHPSRAVSWLLEMSGVQPSTIWTDTTADGHVLSDTWLPAAGMRLADAVGWD
jgi:anti-anti-sigma factor